MIRLFKDQKVLFVLYFALSTLFTWLFVWYSNVYIKPSQMLLSTCVAGGKWGIQVVLAVLILKQQRWIFLKNIAFVCFIGSCVLMPYVGMRSLGLWSDNIYFVGSLVASVFFMIFLYYRAVKISKVSISWWLFWLLCLSTAISLQLTMVFNILHF